MFTIEQIKAAHSKVKSGADFPRYVQDIIKLGVKKYETYVADGHSVYEGDPSFQIAAEAKYATIPVSQTANAEKLKERLEAHQQGETDYMTFIQECASFGVSKWKVDLGEMTCTYFDPSGNTMLVEKIPGG